MTTKPFNLEEAKAGAKLVTRDGRPARIGIWDAKCDQPIIGLVSNRHEGENVASWENDGSYYECGGTSNSDLLILCEPKLRAWKNHEVPVGALLRPKPEIHGTRHWAMLIVGQNPHVEITGRPELILGDGSRVSLETCFNEDEHSTDGGKTWKPAGIEE